MNGTTHVVYFPQTITHAWHSFNNHPLSTQTSNCSWFTLHLNNPTSYHVNTPLSLILWLSSYNSWIVILGNNNNTHSLPITHNKSWNCDKNSERMDVQSNRVEGHGSSHPHTTRDNILFTSTNTGDSSHQMDVCDVGNSVIERNIGDVVIVFSSHSRTQTIVRMNVLSKTID